MIGRRARAQWPLLACLLTVLTLGSTLLGTSALLMTRTSERAIEVAAARIDPDDVRDLLGARLTALRAQREEAQAELDRGAAACVDGGGRLAVSPAA